MTHSDNTGQLRQLLHQPDIAQFADRLAEVPPGYYSNPELAHRVAGGDREDRKVFYYFVDALVDHGTIQAILAMHNRSLLRIIQIPEDLHDLFAEITGGRGR